MKSARVVIFTVLLAAAPVTAEEVLVRNATIWTAADQGILENADLLVRDGKIISIGSNLEAGTGAVVIDGNGMHVTPGLIDAHSHTAIDGGVNEGSNNVTAEVRIGDVVDADDINIYRELAGGLTVANLLHGSANAIGGQNQVIKLKWGATADELKMAGAPEGIKFALGENPKRSNFRRPGAPRYPATRMGVEQSIREAFLNAQAYRDQWKEYEGLKAREQGRTAPPRRDSQLEALVEIMEGKRLVHSHCYRQDEILMLIRLAEEFGFQIATFQHVLEGYKVADEIAAHGAGASTFSDWWAYKLEAYDAIPYNGALMEERGVLVSFNSDSSELARRMNLEAAKSIKYGGLREEEAIKLVTINPARQLGIDNRVGSLEAGKDADFVLWSGHPLSVYSMAIQTWVDGQKEFDRQDDLENREEIVRTRDELISKVLDGKEQDEPVAEEEENLLTIPESRPSTYVDRLAASSGTIAIVGATIHTVSDRDIEQGTVVIENGIITAVGERVDVPADAEVVRAAGMHLYPAMIDAFSALGRTEVGSVAGSVDISETGKINANVRVESSVNPDSELLPVTRANGVLYTLTVPRGGLISGTSALIRLDGWTWEDLTASAPLAMHLNYPAFPAEGRGFFFGPPKSLEEQEKERKEDLALLKKTIESARAYQKALDAGSSALRPDPVLAALIPVLTGDIPVIISATEIRQIKEAVAWARKEGVRMILQTTAAGDVSRVTDLLARHEIPVIVASVLSNRFRRHEPYDHAYATPAKLQEAGVRFCIINSTSGFGTSSTRNLPYHAAMAAAFGLNPQMALKAVTLFAAEILGVGNELGSIEVGKQGSVFLTDGDPLEITTNVVRAFIDGRETALDNRHRRLYEKYRSRPLPVADK